MQLVNAYQTTDGKLFGEGEANLATAHQAKVNLTEALEKEQLLGNLMGSHVEIQYLEDWLENKENAQAMLDYIKTRELVK